MGGEGSLRARIAVTAAYAAQGFGYAVVVTSLPALKQRERVDDLVVTLFVLGVCAAAAAGSVLADLITVRRGSRSALVTGLVLQTAALAMIAIPSAPALFFAGFAVYGIGLGCVDAAAAMQGVIAQRRRGSPLLGGFFAGYTAAAIVGALVVAAVTAIAGSPQAEAAAALGAAAALALVVAIAGGRHLSPVRPPRHAHDGRRRTALPRRAIWAFGFVILVAFTVDSAVSTWSTVYLRDDLGATAWAAPLGYGAYQATVLIARLATDRLVRRAGPRRLAVGAIVLAAAGCVLVAFVPVTAAAVAGFALTGVATGVLVPIAFGAAGDADPGRSDEVIARVNLFTYVGAVAGGVVVGALAEGPGLAAGFLVPAVLLLTVSLVVPAFARGARAAASAR